MTFHLNQFDLKYHQEIMILPTGASRFEEALQMGSETYHHLKVICYSSLLTREFFPKCHKYLKWLIMKRKLSFAYVWWKSQVLASS